MFCCDPECIEEAVAPYNTPLYCRPHYFQTEEWKLRVEAMSKSMGDLSVLKNTKSDKKGKTWD